MHKPIPMKIVRGTSNSFEITVTKDGAEYSLTETQTLVFGLMEDPLRSGGEPRKLFVKKLTQAGDNKYQLDLLPEDTADLEPGQYFYDIGLQDGSNEFYNVIKLSPFIVIPAVTQLGDGES